MGNLVYYSDDFKPLVKEIIFDKDKLYYIAYGRTELRCTDLVKKEDNIIYK
jgi:hypothetical protein